MSRAVEVFGSLVAAGLLSQRECATALGGAAMKRGFKGEKKALHGAIVQALSEAQRDADTRRRHFRVEASDLVRRAIARRQPAKRIIAGIRRLDAEWCDIGFVLSPGEIGDLVEAEIQMALATLAAKRNGSEEQKSWNAGTTS